MSATGERIEWLFHDPGPLASSEVIQIVSESARVAFERLQASDGINVFLSTSEVRKETQLDARRASPGARLYGFVGLRGHVDVRLSDGASVGIGPRVAPIYVPADGRGVLAMKPQAEIRHVGYSILIDRVRQMLGAEIGERFDAFLDGRGITQAVEVATTRQLRQLAVSLFASHLRGPLHLVFVEGVILQLFATHAAAAGLLAEQPARGPSARERQAVEWARERLLADMAEPPGLATLAADAGIGIKALNAGFRSLYGGTVYEVLRDERLDHARIAIETGGLTIKEIASRVGYSHVSNFTSAFTRRFGAPPRRFQKARATPPTRHREPPAGSR